MSNTSSRRDFLKLSTLAAVGLTVAPRSWGQKPRSVNDRIRFGIIGTGGKGWSGTEWAARCGDIVALCDVDPNIRAQAAEVHSKATLHTDYRRMIEDHGDEFDAVIISTPDHHHAFASALAMKHGKHVYCEKPLTRTLWEAREIQKIAKRTGVATQMGNQGSASSDMRRAAAAVKSGAFGKVKEVHCWTDRALGWWPQGVARPVSKPKPADLDWDMWLGPSLEREYADGYHTFAWRGWWDFGAGSLGDIACHMMNMVFRSVDLTNPSSVQALTSGHNRDSFPEWSIITYEYEKNKNRDAFKMYWYDGGKKPPAELAPGINLGGNGKLVICEHATVYAPGDDGYQLVGGGKIPDVPFTESPGHMEEFANAIKGGPAPMSNFLEYAGPLTEVVLLGNLAVWADGPKVPWDARRLRVPGTRDYDRLIHPTYRKGWKL